MWRLFKNKNFRNLMVGSYLSQIGDVMQSFCFSLFILNKTGSTAFFSMILSIAIIPRLILQPVTGVLADKYNKKKLMLISELLCAAVLIILMIYVNTIGDFTLMVIAITTLLINCIMVLGSSAGTSFMPSTVDENELVYANTIATIFSGLINIISPILSGILFPIISLKGITLINIISYFISAVLILTLSVKEKAQNPESQQEHFLLQFKDGLRFCFNNRVLKKILLYALILNFFLTPLGTVAMPFLIKDKLQFSDRMYGIFQGVIYAAAFIGVFLLIKKMREKNAFHVMNMSCLYQGISVLVLAFTFTPFMLGKFSNFGFIITIIILITAAVIFILSSLSNILVSSEMQKEVDEEYRGRVFSIMSTIFLAITPLGQIILGIVLDNIRVDIVIAFIAIVLVICKLILKDKYIENSEVTPKNLNELSENE